METWEAGLNILRYRVAKTHSIPYLYRSFSAKVTYIQGSFVENDLQLRGSYESSPLCNEPQYPGY